MTNEAVSTIGVLLQWFTLNITGSFTLTYFVIMVIILMICIRWNIPAKISLIIGLPLMMVIATYDRTFLTILVMVLIYMAVTLASIMHDQSN